mgnify:CR=1 FL=1
MGDFSTNMNRDKRFLVSLEENVTTGDLILSITQEILSGMDWYEGQELEWIVEGDELLLREVN